MRFAYADPPYEGQAKAHYGEHPDFGGEVDHPALIARLIVDFPDGWALSCKTNSLRGLLPLCPEKTRVLAWVKPFPMLKKYNRVVYAWEPVILMGGRRGPTEQKDDFVYDWLKVGNHTGGIGFAGRKPAEFCHWLFRVWNAQPGDELIDMYPGTGSVAHAWKGFLGQTTMALGGRVPPPAEPILPYESGVVQSCQPGVARITLTSRSKAQPCVADPSSPDAAHKAGNGG